MGYIGVLFLLSFGVLGIACSSKCVPQTAKCSRYWVKIDPHKNFMESAEELDAWCSKQPRFYKCLEDVLLADKNGNTSYLPANLLVSKVFADDLCTEGSTLRKRYLDNAACINQLNTEICSEQKYLDIVMPDDYVLPEECLESEKTFNCIAASLVLNCGFDAGRVIKNILKIAQYSEEVCDVETFFGLPPCEKLAESPKKDDGENKLSEIYYGLMHRIGSIPEQDMEQEESSPDHADASEEEMDDSILDFIGIIYNLVSNDPVDQSIEGAKIEKRMKIVKRDVEEEELLGDTEHVEVTTEPLVQSTRDNSYEDEETVEVTAEPGEVSYETTTTEPEYESTKAPTPYRRNRHRVPVPFTYYPPLVPVRRERPAVYEPHMKHPTITEVYKDLLVYNYSDIEYALYWRQPEFTILQSIYCFHLEPSFSRGVVFRCERDFRTRERDCVSNETVHEPVTPALIRDLDPEIPEDASIEFGPRPWWMKDVDYAIKKIQRGDLRSKDERGPKKPPCIPKLEQPDPVMFPHQKIFPDDMFETMEIALKYGLKSLIPFLNFQIGGSIISLSFHPAMNKFENLTCSRLDECDPRGKGLFKCKLLPRVMESCIEYGCYGGTGFAPAEHGITLPYVTKEPCETEGAGETEGAEDGSLGVTGDVNSVKEASNENLDIQSEHDPLLYMSDQASVDLADVLKLYSEDLPNSSLRLMILGEDSVEPDSDITPGLAYAIDNMEVLEDDQELELIAPTEMDHTEPDGVLEGVPDNELTM